MSPQPKTACLMNAKIICKQPGRYLAWPTVVCQPDGTLCAVFSGDRDGHMCPFGKILLITSSDHGETWSEPRVIADTPLDDRDAGLCLCDDGTLVVSWATSHYEDYENRYPVFMYRPGIPADRWKTWERKIATISEDDVKRWAPSEFVPATKSMPARWLGFWTMRSHDGGLTWDEPAPAPVHSPHGSCAFGDGILYAGLYADKMKPNVRNVGVASSLDKGKTWKWLSSFPCALPYPGEIPSGTARLTEPHVTVTPSGKILLLSRYEESGKPERSFLWQTESTDGGITWTPLHETRLLGKPPHLLRLKDGRILVSYGFRLKPFGQRACLSGDEGQTWDVDQEILIRDDAPNRDLGYAASAECSDGSIVTVYYQVECDGEAPCIMMSRFRIAD